MPYSMKRESSPFKGGKNILASEHFQFIHVGATLDNAAFIAAFPTGVVPIGCAVARNTTTGKYVPYVTGDNAGTPVAMAGVDNLCILNIDLFFEGYDQYVGELLIKGSVYDAKLPANVTATFKDLTKHQFFFVKRIG